MPGNNEYEDERWTVRDKSYQGRGFVIAESGNCQTIAENLTEDYARLIVNAVNKFRENQHHA